MAPNQGISVALSRMSIGVYRDDRATFGFVRCSGQKLNSIEIAFNHYANRRGGLALPQTTALIASLRPVNQGTSKFIPWDTLTHAELGSR